MNEINYQEALSVFSNHLDNYIIEPIHGGLINNSYKVTNTDSKTAFLLQQINRDVFKHPEEVQQNYVTLWHFTEFEFTGFFMPAPIMYDDVNSLFVDNKGNYWRAFEFIQNAYSISLAERAQQVKATSGIFGRFTACLEEMEVDQLNIVIPDFHNLSFRYEQFEESMKTEMYERLAKAMPLVDELKKRERYKHFYEIIIESEEFPRRVMHHDAKIANVLFDLKTNKVVCPVDFDTTMPGYYFSDIGDMIRSMACSHDENHTKFDDIRIKKSFYKAIVEGYLAAMKDQLTSSEKKYIHYAGLILIYMQALRFISDYLNGDVYYKINYPEQNFDRSKNQLTLLGGLEKFLLKEYAFKV